MCGVGGYTGLGHIAAELRYDLVEALGIGLDKRGGHAAGAVTVPEEGQPRLMRKLGTWGAARGRFLRAAAAGHSVMMHTRYATTGSKDSVENAHPFAVKRKTLDGEERTVLYGCHNGMIHGAWETAKKNGREFTVDSKEFFELLADAAYETIRALSGYGVVTFIRPEDRAIRVLRLTRNSDFHAVRLVGGGVVWGSTESIVKDALEYVSLQVDAVLDISKVTDGNIGRVYRLSGQEAVETKLDNVCLNASQTDRRTSGGTYYGYDDGWYAYGGNDGTGYSRNSGYTWEDACYDCGRFSYHDNGCQFKHSVVARETIRENRAAHLELKAKREAERETERIRKAAVAEKREKRERTISKAYVECEDETFRQVDERGNIVPFAYPIYVKDRAGEYRMAATASHASHISGREVAYTAKPKNYQGLGYRRLTAAEAPESTQRNLLPAKTEEPTGHNGHWSVPPGLSEEEKREWLELYKDYPGLAKQLADQVEDLRRRTEEADLEDAAKELEKTWAEACNALTPEKADNDS